MSFAQMSLRANVTQPIYDLLYSFPRWTVFSHGLAVSSFATQGQG